MYTSKVFCMFKFTVSILLELCLIYLAKGFKTRFKRKIETDDVVFMKIHEKSKCFIHAES